MRLRNKPWAPEYLNNNKHYFYNESLLLDKNFFKSNYNENPLHLEIGTGKGNFIEGLAKDNLNINYIALEKFPSVLVILLKRIENEKLNNLKLITMDANKLSRIFEPNSIDKIYINFPDPWPKERHAKRRLMSTDFLEQYYKILKKDGIIEFKSDQKILYKYWFEVLKEFKGRYKILKKSRNLHFFNNVKYTTEYERKFTKLGNRIYFIKIKKL